jgi:hypothetical protein
VAGKITVIYILEVTTAALETIWEGVICREFDIGYVLHKKTLV